MTASFRKIDYSLRPAKHAERRMLCEAFRQMRPFQPVEDYIYVGFGSVWFADFVLFHRALGIREMLSIEEVAGAKDRVEANKPFRAITVDYRHSSRVLPELDWNKRHFIWLDYDSPISEAVLHDIATVASHARSGSALAVSVQCQQAADVALAEEESEGPAAMARFRDRFGRERIPENVSEEDLYGWPFASLSRRMLHSEIEATLASRNAAATPQMAIQFNQIFNVEYQDGARMATICGVFVQQNENRLFEACGFGKLDFLPQDGNTFRIEIPKLTTREIRFLEQQLPRLAAGDVLALGAIPASDAGLYADLYRYFPNFAVLEH